MSRERKLERSRARRVVAALTSVVAVVGSLSLTALPAVASTCVEATVAAPVVADTWLDEGSPSSAKGGDSVLSVDAGSVNVDTGVASGRNRTLVRFAMPDAPPPGCVVASARLMLNSIEESAGTKVEVAALDAAWTENGATWENQPAAAGAATASWSRQGAMQWTVTAQVSAQLEAGTDHGFVVREAAEGTEHGARHAFYSREKGDGDSDPELVIHFAAPGSDEPDGPPAPPVATTVQCGQVLTRSTLVTNDLSGCPGDGLVVGAPRIIVDLGGRTVGGVGLGSGVRNPGHASVVVRNGTVDGFDYGVQLDPDTTLNVVEGLTLRANQVAAVELFDVSASAIRGNSLDGNGGGIVLVSGTRDSVVANNTVTGNGGAGLLLQDADGNRLEHNSVTGGGDLGIGLERSGGNTLLGNSSTANSDGGIEVSEGSHGNRVEGNTVTASGDNGILVADSDRNELIDNVSHFMSDSGITLDTANDGLVRGNDLRFNPGGLEVSGSSGNRIERNNASSGTGVGIELGDGALRNVIEANTVASNDAQGIYVAGDVIDALGNPVPGAGNVLRGNTVSGNRADGIVTAKGGHTIVANITTGNLGRGISAAPGSIDGGGNIATNGQTCTGVVCRVEWSPPETEITAAPVAEGAGPVATFEFVGHDNASPATGLRFACSRDGAAFTPCSSPTTYAPLTAGEHTFAVRATDAAGNVDPSPASHTWTVLPSSDTTPPDTAIDSGPSGLTSSASAAFTFTASEPDVVFECALDAAAFSPCTSPRQHTGLTAGPHTFHVRAMDSAGNVDATPASRTWTVDVTAPNTTIGAGPSGTTTSRSATLAFASSEAGATFQCSLDGAAFTACTSPSAYSGLAAGSHTFRVRAVDAAGNIDATPATRTWTIQTDTRPPNTSITSGPSGTVPSRSATFRFSAGEAGATFQCSLDGAAFTACTSPLAYSGLAVGSHTFRVRAVDAAGNIDATPATRTWTIRA